MHYYYCFITITATTEDIYRNYIQQNFDFYVASTALRWEWSLHF